MSAARLDDPASWPLVTVLPLRRDAADGGFPELGYLEHVRGQPVAPRVVLGTIGERPTGAESFLSWDTLAAAGWRID